MNNQRTSKKKKLDESYLDSFIADRIKQIRIARNITQGQLAEKLNLSSQQAYSSYERGKAKISATTLYLLAHALEVTMEDFFPTSVNNNISKELKVVLGNLKSHEQKYSSDILKLELVLRKIDKQNK